MGLGDITDGNSTQEWQRTQESFWLLGRNGVAHSQVRGNHDGKEQFELFLGSDMDYQDSIRFDWKKEENWFAADIVLPEGTEAVLELPNRKPMMVQTGHIEVGL